MEFQGVSLIMICVLLNVAWALGFAPLGSGTNHPLDTSDRLSIEWCGKRGLNPQGSCSLRRELPPESKSGAFASFAITALLVVALGR